MHIDAVIKTAREVGDDSDEELSIAKASLIFAELDSAGEQGFDPAYVLDIESETAPYIALFQRDEDRVMLIDELTQSNESHTISHNLLILETLEIEPEYRGRGVSGMIWEDVVRLYGGQASIAVLHAKPDGLNITRQNIDDRGWSIKLETLSRDDLKAVNALRICFAELGFKLLGRGDLMYTIL